MASFVQWEAFKIETIVGSRVYVKNFLFEGWAVINGIFPGEVYPVQVEMKKGDDHRHKIKRVAYDEIQMEPNEHPGELIGDEIVYSSANPDNEPVRVKVADKLPTNGKQVAVIIKEYKGYGWKVGDQYIVTPTYRGNGTHYYMYDMQDKHFKGCMPIEIFKVIGPYVPVIQPEEIETKRHDPDIKPEIVEQKEVQALQKRTDPHKKQKGVADGQLDMFDFL